MRLFVALDVPPGAKEMLTALQRRLVETGMSGRPTRQENMHITLRFLGEVADKHAQTVCSAMEDALLGQLAPMVRISGVGAFVRAAGDTVFAQLDGDLQAVFALQQRVVRTLAPLGFRGDGRPFTPHITLFRNADFRGRGLRARSDDFFLSTVSVYASKLGAGFDGGPLYTRLCEIVLSR
jgi:2'-5' RNA ligase